MPEKTKLIKKGVVISIHVLAWITITYIFNQIFRTEFRTFTNVGRSVTENIVIHTFLSFIIIVLAFKAVLFYLNAFYRPYFLYGSQKKLQYAVLSCCAVGVLLVLECLSILIAVRLWKVSHPPFRLFIWPEVLTWLMAFAISFTWAKMREWDKAEQLSKKIADEQVRTELNFLKAQISPHFFLNTLNNLYSMAQANKINELEEGILQLSELMQYMLYDCQADRVPVQREIECIRSYIGLTLLRYRQDGSIVVNFTVEEKNLAGATMAPVILLPFIENAFKHGISSDKSSLIEIELFAENSQLKFRVRNTDHSEDRQHLDKKGIGFNNVKRRLEMLYPGKYDLEINRKNGFYSILLKLTGNEMRYN
jgi:two-component system LytT family sensor kinase